MSAHGTVHLLTVDQLTTARARVQDRLTATLEETHSSPLVWAYECGWARGSCNGAYAPLQLPGDCETHRTGSS